MSFYSVISASVPWWRNLCLLRDHKDVLDGSLWKRSFTFHVCICSLPRTDVFIGVYHRSLSSHGYLLIQRFIGKSEPFSTVVLSPLSWIMCWSHQTLCSVECPVHYLSASTTTAIRQEVSPALLTFLMKHTQQKGTHTFTSSVTPALSGNYPKTMKSRTYK